MARYVSEKLRPKRYVSAKLESTNQQFNEKTRVYLWKDPTIEAVVLRSGPQQSEIKFPNGNVRTVCNAWLTQIKAEEPLLRYKRRYST